VEIGELVQVNSWLVWRQEKKEEGDKVSVRKETKK